MALVGTINKRFSRSNLIELFFVVAFPIHVWTLIGVLRDVELVVNRTDVWDAVGLGAYSMVFAFFESILLLLVMMLLSFLLPLAWGEKKIRYQISGYYYVFAIWAMLGQAYFMFEKFPRIVNRGIRFIQSSQWLFFIILVLIIIASIIIPMWQINKSKKIRKFISKLNENLMLLTLIYVLLDIVGLIIILYRNLV